MRFAFGHHELDAERFELRREGEFVAIQPKVLELIIHLIRNRDRAVGSEELFRAVWAETVVTKSSLARAVSLARRAIGDDGRSPAAIVTVPSRGYRFEAEVDVISDSPADDDPSSRYVGRTHILARAHAALDAALAGHGRILLLVGEAGIGKTRTAELLCERGRAARAEVAAIWGLNLGNAKTAVQAKNAAQTISARFAHAPGSLRRRRVSRSGCPSRARAFATAQSA